MIGNDAEWFEMIEICLWMIGNELKWWRMMRITWNDLKSLKNEKNHLCSVSGGARSELKSVMLDR